MASRETLHYMNDLEQKVAALTTRVTELETVGQRLINKMQTVYDSPEYKSVWESWQAHHGRYNGETWVKEFNALATVLEREKE